MAFGGLQAASQSWLLSHLWQFRSQALAGLSSRRLTGEFRKDWMIQNLSLTLLTSNVNVRVKHGVN